MRTEMKTLDSSGLARACRGQHTSMRDMHMHPSIDCAAAGEGCGLGSRVVLRRARTCFEPASEFTRSLSMAVMWAASTIQEEYKGRLGE